MKMSIPNLEMKHGKNYKDFSVQIANDVIVITAVDKRDGGRYVVAITEPKDFYW